MELVDSFLDTIGESRQQLHDPLAMLIKTTIDLLTHHQEGQSGGLPGLLDASERASLGDIARSWVDNGPNQPMSPEQATQLLGGGAGLERLAYAIGATPAETARNLSDIVPSLVDELTPNGKVDPLCECKADLGSSIYLQTLTQRGKIMLG